MNWNKFKWRLLIIVAIISYPIPFVPSTILVILCITELYNLNNTK